MGRGVPFQQLVTEPFLSRGILVGTGVDVVSADHLQQLPAFHQRRYMLLVELSAGVVDGLEQNLRHRLVGIELQLCHHGVRQDFVLVQSLGIVTQRELTLVCLALAEHTHGLHVGNQRTQCWLVDKEHNRALVE